MTEGAFHSMKNSGLNFRKFSATNGTAFSETSGKEGNIVKSTQIFGNFVPKISAPFDIQLNGSLFGN